MNHDEIIKSGIVERYVFGELSPEEEAQFEEHYFACDTCFQEVQATEKFVRGLKTSFEKESPGRVAIKPDWKSAFFGWFRQPILSPVAAIGTIMIILLAYPAWMGLVDYPKLRESFEETLKPSSGLQSIFLQQVRSADQDSVPTLVLNEGQKFFQLDFNILSKKSPSSRFEGEIVDSQGNTVWGHILLKESGPYEVFEVLCNSKAFKAGKYELIIKEIETEKGREVGMSSLPFRIIEKADLSTSERRN